MAIAGVCVTLISCRTGDPVYYFTYNTDVINTINGIGIGNVAEINDPVNFPDTYYTISAYCNSFNVGCEYCNDPENTVINDQDGLLYRYWYASDYGSECPQNDALVTAYVLVNCLSTVSFTDPNEILQSPKTALVTSSDLSLYVNMVIKIEEYPDFCYQVLGPYTTNTGCPCDLVTVTNGFENCECCLPTEDPNCCEIPKYTQKPVKNYFRITDSDCDIDANTRFANNYYKLFTGIRYGIQSCCDDINYEKTWMQKQIADYQKMIFSTCETSLPDLCLYVTGNQLCGSQTATYNDFVNGKWSWIFTRSNGVEAMIYWDNINNFWVCEDTSTLTVISKLLLNTDYPVGTNTEWISVVDDTCLSVNNGLSTWTIPCELCPSPDPID